MPPATPVVAPIAPSGTALAAALAANAAASRLRSLRLLGCTVGNATAAGLGAALAAQAACGNSCGLRDLSLANPDADAFSDATGTERGVGLAGAEALAAGVRRAGWWLESVGVGVSYATMQAARPVLQEAAEAWLLGGGSAEEEQNENTTSSDDSAPAGLLLGDESAGGRPARRQRAPREPLNLSWEAWFEEEWRWRAASKGV